MGLTVCHCIPKCCESLPPNQDIDIDFLHKTRRSAFEAKCVHIGTNEQYKKPAIDHIKIPNNSYSEYEDDIDCSPISVMNEETINIVLGMKSVDKLNDETLTMEEYNPFDDIFPEQMKQELISNIMSPEISDNSPKQSVEYNRSDVASTDSINTEDTEDTVQSDIAYEKMQQLTDWERMSGNKSNLMRMENNALWEEDDMNELENEMKNQLKFLKINSLSMDGNIFDDAYDDDDDDGILVINADCYTHHNINCNHVEDDDNIESKAVFPNLLRSKSVNKWDINDIHVQTNEIKQQIVRLSSQQYV